MGEERMTKRMMAAMDHPLVDVIGHPTGRKILQREPYAVSVEQLVAHAAETGTFLEINANPDRRDLKDVDARLAAEAGVPIVINSDAHSRRTLSVIRYGVATARRGWLTKENVANTRTWPQLDKLRKRSRKKAVTSRRR
jgi:DNA polymerase (family 10)